MTYPQFGSKCPWLSDHAKKQCSLKNNHVLGIQPPPLTPISVNLNMACPKLGIYDLLSYPNPPKKLTVVKYDPGDVGGNVQNMSLGCTYNKLSLRHGCV